MLLRAGIHLAGVFHHLRATFLSLLWSTTLDFDVMEAAFEPPQYQCAGNWTMLLDLLVLLLFHVFVQTGATEKTLSRKDHQSD